MKNLVKRCLVGILICAFAMGFFSLPRVAGAATDKFKGQELTILIWGTTWNYGVKFAAEKFEKEYGVKVRHMTQTNAAEGLVKLQSMKGKPSVDVWFTISSTADRADPDLLTEIPESTVTNKADLVNGALAKKFVGFYYYPFGIIYRPDLVPRPPKTWEDLWDPAFKGKIGITSASFFQAYFLVLCAYLNGGNENNITPGFEKVKAILPNVVTIYDSDATGRKILAQGEVAVALGPPSYMAYLVQQNIPAKVVSPKPTPIMFDVMTIVKGGKEELAAEFIKFMVTYEAQEVGVTPLKMVPVNKKVPPAKELEGAVPNPADTISFDTSVINKNIGSWVERWNREIATK